MQNRDIFTTFEARKNTTQLAKYPRVLYVKPSNKVYVLTSIWTFKEEGRVSILWRCPYYRCRVYMSFCLFRTRRTDNREVTFTEMKNQITRGIFHFMPPETIASLVYMKGNTYLYMSFHLLCSHLDSGRYMTLEYWYTGRWSDTHLVQHSCTHRCLHWKNWNFEKGWTSIPISLLPLLMIIYTIAKVTRIYYQR